MSPIKGPFRVIETHILTFKAFDCFKCAVRQTFINSNSIRTYCCEKLSIITGRFPQELYAINWTLVILHLLMSARFKLFELAFFVFLTKLSELTKACTAFSAYRFRQQTSCWVLASSVGFFALRT